MEEITTEVKLFELLDILGCIIAIDEETAVIDTLILERQTEEDLAQDEFLDTEEIW